MDLEGGTSSKLVQSLSWVIMLSCWWTEKTSSCSIDKPEWSIKGCIESPFMASKFGYSSSRRQQPHQMCPKFHLHPPFSCSNYTNRPKPHRRSCYTAFAALQFSHSLHISSQTRHRAFLLSTVGLPRIDIHKQFVAMAARTQKLVATMIDAAL